MTHLLLKGNELYEFNRMKFMGIINATPDSFFEGSRNENAKLAVQKAIKLIEQGADIIDIGGESTRPGCDPVTVDEEISRVIPVIEGIREIDKKVLISIDTYRSETARRAILAGGDIINDISAMSFDDKMAEVVKEFNVPVILMHIKGTPKNMQMSPVYDDVVREVTDFFKERIAYAIKQGISRDKLILDPGIGFGKLYEHNIELIKRIGEFHGLDLPILLAVSRKSTIGIALGNVPTEERLEGTVAVSCYAALKNVEIVRVHDVLENKRAVTMMEALK